MEGRKSLCLLLVGTLFFYAGCGKNHIESGKSYRRPSYLNSIPKNNFEIHKEENPIVDNIRPRGVIVKSLDDTLEKSDTISKESKLEVTPDTGSKISLDEFLDIVKASSIVKESKNVLGICPSEEAGHFKHLMCKIVEAYRDYIKNPSEEEFEDFKGWFYKKKSILVKMYNDLSGAAK